MTKSDRNSSNLSIKDGLDIYQLSRALWARKFLISLIMAVFMVISIVVAMLLPNTYRAEVLLAPNDQDGIGGASALAAQYGGLASLAGIDLGNNATDKTALGLEVLQSRKFISGFIDRHNILVPLIAAEGWSIDSNELKIDSSLYDLKTNKWVRKVRPPKQIIPTLQEAYERFSEILKVEQDNRTGFVTVSLEFFAPAIAAQWVEWLVDDLNATTMRQDVSEAEQAISYLKVQMGNTSLAELRNVFSRLIEEQTKTVMLASMSPEYLFRIVDPAVAPERKSGPNRLLIVVAGTLLGIFLGTLFVLVRSGTEGE